MFAIIIRGTVLFFSLLLWLALWDTLRTWSYNYFAESIFSYPSQPASSVLLHHAQIAFLLNEPLQNPARISAKHCAVFASLSSALQSTHPHMQYAPQLFYEQNIAIYSPKYTFMIYRSHFQMLLQFTQHNRVVRKLHRVFF